MALKAPLEHILAPDPVPQSSRSIPIIALFNTIKYRFNTDHSCGDRAVVWPGSGRTFAGSGRARGAADGSAEPGPSGGGLAGEDARQPPPWRGVLENSGERGEWVRWWRREDWGKCGEWSGWGFWGTGRGSRRRNLAQEMGEGARSRRPRGPGPELLETSQECS
jgi:hypothetical protein